MTAIKALSTGSINNADNGSVVVDSSPKGNDAAAMMFAAIFGNWMNQHSGQEQDSDDQSNAPAGKEANSGRNALLGIEGLQAMMAMLQGEGNLQEVLARQVQNPMSEEEFSGQLNLLLSQMDTLRGQSNFSNPLGTLEVAQMSGMTGQLQGNTPQSELDLYKNVIVDLLTDMSGEVKVKTHPEGLNTLTQQKSAIAAQRFNSGLFIGLVGEGQASGTGIAADKVTVAQTAIGQSMTSVVDDVEVQVVPSTQQGNGQGTLVSALATKPAEGAVGLEENIAGTLGKNGPEGTAKHSGVLNMESENPGNFQLPGEQDPKGQSSTQNGANQGKGSGSDKSLGTGVGLQEKGSLDFPKDEQFTLQDSHMESVVGLSSTKETSQVQGKVLEKGTPVWTQVANEVFEKAYQARPQLREMIIHLRPAELGQINISMRWEEGQMHIRMVATDAGTGQLLQTNLSDLRDNLTQLGIQCGMMEMGLGEQNRHSQEGQGQEDKARAQENGDEKLGFTSNEELESMMDSQVDEQGIRRINVTA
ncbi:flagellar hook-length control protein [Desulfitobacterium dichloroeliminans LMG P-21439]|uniref:Flagellar hook-length control protein n=1 Tax=Desulfitobacterium dichloroeliminans (strain LMG P-21439 / DCA1) TaxID=871963 RepID=L0FC80_DESDL|nr:flagellar hook-length control protein FliK [Desulfitobacterium dichloroeliminans]AGA70261.1 flagellar hook-length control protein [Desulfitobacterium dichloroeliminans LMG P-21439]